MDEEFDIEEFIATIRIYSDTKWDLSINQLRSALEKNDPEKIKQHAKPIQSKVKSHPKAKYNATLTQILGNLVQTGQSAGLRLRSGTPTAGARGLQKGAVRGLKHADKPKSSSGVPPKQPSGSDEDPKTLVWFTKALTELESQIEKDQYREIECLTKYPEKCGEIAVRIGSIEKKLSQNNAEQKTERSEHFKQLDGIKDVLRKINDSMLKKDRTLTKPESEDPTHLLDVIKTNIEAQTAKIENLQSGLKKTCTWIYLDDDSLKGLGQEFTDIQKAVRGKVDKENKVKQAELKAKAEELDVVKNDLQQQTDETEKKAKECKTLQEQRQTSQTCKDNLQTEYNSLKKENDINMQRMADIENEIRRLEEDLKKGNLSDDMKDYDKTNNCLYTLDSVRSTIRETQEKDQEALRRLEEKHRTQIIQLKEDIEKSLIEVDSDTKKHIEAENEIHSIRKLFQQLNDKCGHLRMKNETLQSELTALQSNDGRGSKQSMVSAKSSTASDRRNVKGAQNDDKTLLSENENSRTDLNGRNPNNDGAPATTSPKNAAEAHKARSSVRTDELLKELRHLTIKQKNRLVGVQVAIQDLPENQPLEKTLEELVTLQTTCELELRIYKKKYETMKAVISNIYKYQHGEQANANITDDDMCENVIHGMSVFKRKEVYDQFYKEYDRLVETLQAADFEQQLGKLKVKDNSIMNIVKIVLQRIRNVSKKTAVAEKATKTSRSGKSTEQKLMDLQAENEELLTRLSKFAGAQLMKDNPDIADLSDPNRPTKLGEKYSQLYDNEYTEAFEVLDDKKHSRSEIQIVDILRSILTTAYELCTEYSNAQVEEIIMLLHYPGCLKEKFGSGKITELTNAIQKVSLSTLRKETSELPFDHIKKLLWKKLQRHGDLKKELESEKSKVSLYAERCAELCWMMSVQSPPVFLDIAAGQKQNCRFDKNVFREYTASGPTVAFVVWPPLYITEKGALLAKGIAQGK